jgi:hypothetical protein
MTGHVAGCGQDSLTRSVEYYPHKSFKLKIKC